MYVQQQEDIDARFAGMGGAVRRLDMNESGGALSVVGVPDAPVTSAGSVGADSSDTGVRNKALVAQIWGSIGRVSGSNSGEKEKSRNPTPESKIGVAHKKDGTPIT